MRRAKSMLLLLLVLLQGSFVWGHHLHEALAHHDDPAIESHVGTQLSAAADADEDDDHHSTPSHHRISDPHDLNRHDDPSPDLAPVALDAVQFLVALDLFPVVDQAPVAFLCRPPPPWELRSVPLII